MIIWAIGYHSVYQSQFVMISIFSAEHVIIDHDSYVSLNSLNIVHSSTAHPIIHEIVSCSFII